MILCEEKMTFCDKIPFLGAKKPKTFVFFPGIWEAALFRMTPKKYGDHVIQYHFRFYLVRNTLKS